MKKVLSLVLVIAMVLSSMSFAFASTFADIADTDYEEAIETLIALGVIDGYDDGSFKPEKTVTRAEMAKLMVQLLGYGNLTAGQKSNFTDTQGHWADAWISIAAGRGIVVGTGNGKFDPERTVSYDEVLTMLVRGLGYTDSCNELKNMTWPTNFKVKAAELNITKNVDMKVNDADRGGVAQAMRNALDQQLVKVNSDGDVVKQFKTEKVADSSYYTDKPINLITLVAAEKEITVDFDHLDPTSKDYAGDRVDLSKYLFQKVTVYCNRNNDKEVVYIGDADSVTYSDTVDSVEVDSKDSDKLKLEVGDYTFTVSKNFSTVSYNNDQISLDEFDNVLTDLDDAKATVIVSNARVTNDATVIGVVLEKATAYVQVEEEYKTDATEIDEIYLPVKDKKVDSKNLIITGDATELSDIKADDIISAYTPYDDEDPTVDAPDKLKLVVTRKPIEGKVTGTASDAYYIDRTKYKFNDALGVSGLDVGDDGTFYLDDDGKIIAFSGDSDSSNTYAVVNDDVNINGEFKIGTGGRFSVTDTPEVKIDTASGETITYKFDVELDNKGKIKNSEVAKLFTVDDSAKTISFKYDLFTKENNEFFGKLVTYSLNKDNKITKFSIIDRTLDTRTDSSSFVLAQNAVIFDKSGKVISEDDLGITVKGVAAYKNGKIVALLANIKADEGTKYFAYVTAVGKDSDKNDNKIQRLTAYIKGSENSKLFTTDENTVTGGTKEYYMLTLNSNGEVKKADKIDKNDERILKTTASAIDSRTGEITIKEDGKDKTLYFDEGAATVLVLKDGKVDSYNKRVNDSLIKTTEGKETEFRYILNPDSTTSIGYIIIGE